MDNKQRNFFIQEHLQKSVFHGGVGNIDIERILLEQGYQAIVFPFHFDFSLKAKWFRYMYLLKLLYTLPAGATIVFQFPLYARMHLMLLQLLRWRSSIRVICIIADINGLKDGDDKVMDAELAILRRFRYFIVHGIPMEKWLKKRIPGVSTSLLYFFDFLSVPVETARQKSGVIAFAGNLAKSPFLEKLHLITALQKELHFNLYGPEVTTAMMHQPAVSFKGVYPPYELPSIIEGAFGLLWDGESIEGAGGSLGDYMQYISHHKLSLYILAGLPVIVYENAGSANMVKELNIGITVNSIFEVGERVKQLSDNEYQLMRQNMKPIADRISKGDYLLSAIVHLHELMDKNSV